MTKENSNSRRISRTLPIVSAISLLVLWPLAVVVLYSGKTIGLAICLFASGIAQGPILFGYAFVRIEQKQWWRWFVLAISGIGILIFSLVDSVNLDIDGFFELLILGTMGPAIGHTMITTIIGPLIFGRVLCGWGCWRSMVLERLPVSSGSGRRKGFWIWMPLVSVLVSFVAAVLIVMVLDSQPNGGHRQMLNNSIWPIIGGISVYYATAITLALVLHDQRAFCKYLCPTGCILRWTSRPALLHVSAENELCNDCEACMDVCPMDIPIIEHMRLKARIGNGDCILCQRCVEICPTGALKTSFKK